MWNTTETREYWHGFGIEVRMEVYLRDVTELDRELLYRWANDEDVRKNSFSTKRISYEEHCEWFAKVMQNEYCKQWILQAGEEPVGQIRITIEGENAEIGYSICAEHRGVGYGKLLLELARRRVQMDLPNVKKLIARVKPGNIASLKAFESCGYKTIFEQLELEMDVHI